MSAPPLTTAVTTSASGYSDGFGRRLLAFGREDGVTHERLYLRPLFALYEHALRDTFASLPFSADSSIIAPHMIERDAETGEVVAVSAFVSGERLGDLLEAAADRTPRDGSAPGIDVALGFLLDVLPTLQALRAVTESSHGAVTSSRCVLTPDGRVVLTECGFAAVLQRLNLSRERFWSEFGIAIPPAGAATFDQTGDISQAALLAAMIIVGRPIQARDAADVLPDLLAESVEIAHLRENVSLAVNLQRFLQRALPLAGRRPYHTIEAALHDVNQLASAIGTDSCRAALSEFVRHATGAIAPDADSTAGERRAATPVPNLDSAGAAAPAIAAPPTAPTEEAVSPLALEPATVEAEEPGAALVLDAVIPEQPSTQLPDQEPVLEPSQSRRRRRSGRADQDTLRSAVVPPKPEPRPGTHAIAVAPVEEMPGTEAPGPIVPSAEPAPVIVAAATATPQPVAALSGPGAAPAAAAAEPIILQPLAAPPVIPHQDLAPLADAPAIPQPVFAPLAAPPLVPQPMIPQPVFAEPTTPAAERLWTPPIVLAPPAAPPPQPIGLAQTKQAPLRLKTEPPPGFQGQLPRREPREVFAGYGAARARRVPWKLAAVAAALLITVFVAGRAYLPDTPAVNASVTRTEPITVAAPPPVTTGTIVVQTQPSGARVLLDGSPAGETPLRIVDVAPGRHVLTFVTPTATLRRTVKVEANKTLTLDVPVFSGWVAIFAPIVLEVSEEGRSLGSTDQGRLLLPPGRHTLTLTNRDFGYSADHAVEIEAGEVRSLNVQPTGTLNLNAVPWAEVWIEGKKAGDTPLANLQLPLGNREIIFKHPEFGERRMMTRVTAVGAVAVSVDFSR